MNELNIEAQGFEFAAEVERKDQTRLRALAQSFLDAVDCEMTAGRFELAIEYIDEAAACLRECECHRIEAERYEDAARRAREARSA